MAAVMVIPSPMLFLSLVMPTGVNRWVNIVFGAVYSVIMILVIRGGWHFLFGLIRNHPDSTYRLVRMDLAEAANPLIEDKSFCALRLTRLQNASSCWEASAIAMAADVAETTQIERPPRGREEVPVQSSRLLDAHQVIIRKLAR